MKEYSDSGLEKEYCLKKTKGREPAVSDLSDPKFSLESPVLDGITSKQHGTRYNYLKVNILYRYYSKKRVSKRPSLGTERLEGISQQPIGRFDICQVRLKALMTLNNKGSEA